MPATIPARSGTVASLSLLPDVANATATTTTTTNAGLPTPVLTPNGAKLSCGNCGSDLSTADPEPPDQHVAALSSAHRRIAELEAQVRLMGQKASAAADRCADYEDEIHRLRSQARKQQEDWELQQVQKQLDPSPPLLPSTTPAAAAAAAANGGRRSSSSFLPLSLSPSRLSSFLSKGSSNPSTGRARPSPVGSPGPGHESLGLPPRTPPPFASRSLALPPSPNPSAEDLLEALSREQMLRQEAEGRLSATSREVEELSATLFEQANEMVATERRARAKLEERIEVLEQRDKDRQRRLGRLDAAMSRIEKAREMLGTMP